MRHSIRIHGGFPAAIALALALAASGALAHGGVEGKQKDNAAAHHSPATYSFGRPGSNVRTNRVITIETSDRMRFTPSMITVKRDETVRFVIRNRGRLFHELVLGTMNDLREHAEMMKKHPEMEHDEPNAAHVAPGKTQDLVWQFTQSGEFHFGCLIPGHFDAGMTGKIIVTAK